MNTLTREKERRISISQFSELTDISRDTLVYYIKEGLITPAVTDSNGYHYFYPDQIRTMTFIKYMRQFGIHIQEIKSILAGMDTNGIYEILNAHNHEIETRIRNISQSIHFLDLFSEFIEFMETHPLDRPFFTDLKKANLYLTPVRFCHSLNQTENAEAISHFLEFKDEGLPEFLMCCRIPQQIIKSGNFCKFMQNNAKKENQDKIIERPAGTYACIVHEGGNGTVKSTVHSLTDYISRQEKTAAGDAYVISSSGFFNLTSSDRGKYLVEIPVSEKPV